MSKIKRFIARFMFAWHYAYNTKKWQAFTDAYDLKDPRESNE